MMATAILCQPLSTVTFTSGRTGPVTKLSERAATLEHQAVQMSSPLTRSWPPTWRCRASWPAPTAELSGSAGIVASCYSDAIQLARQAGYRVIATASPRNFDHVRSLGAVAAVDYNSSTAADELVTAIGGSPLAGTLAIGNGSLAPTMAVASKVQGSRRIASAQPALVNRIQSLLRRHKRIRVSSIWGGTLKDNAVGPAIYVDFLPGALAKGVYRAVPEAAIAGEGLDKIPDALEQLRKGVSAMKIVVTVDRRR